MRIGDAQDMLARGRVSRVNAAAEALGIVPDVPCAAVLAHLEAAAPCASDVPHADEARSLLDPPGATRRIVLVDSASLVQPIDAGAIIITASHDGLGGRVQRHRHRPRRAGPPARA